MNSPACNVTLRILLVFVALGFLPTPGALAQTPPAITLKAELILASNAEQPTDPRLRPYESRLRKIFKFNSYRRIDNAAVRIVNGRPATLSIGDGYSLVLTPMAADSRRYRIGVTWKRNRKTLVETTLNLSRDAPAILGGPGANSGTLILVINAAW